MAGIGTGNVIKTPHGNIVIVTRVKTDYIDCVSFDHEGSSGGGNLKDHVRPQTCYCNENYDLGQNYDPDCPDCKGTGSYEVKIIGLEHSKILAPNVKEYILKSLTKNFDW